MNKKNKAMRETRCIQLLSVVDSHTILNKTHANLKLSLVCARLTTPLQVFIKPGCDCNPVTKALLQVFTHPTNLEVKYVKAWVMMFGDAAVWFLNYQKYLVLRFTFTSKKKNVSAIF